MRMKKEILLKFLAEEMMTWTRTISLMMKINCEVKEIFTVLRINRM